MKNTTESKPAKSRCPMCGRPSDVQVAPFCSRRCANDDLAHWLGGKYAIPGDERENPVISDDSEGPQ